MAGALLASIQQAAYLLNAPISQAARAIDALRIKATADPSILKGAAPAPTPVAPVAEVTEVVEEQSSEAEATAEVTENNDSAAEPAAE
jgi:large subunit ribosomal protein L10